MHNQGVLFGEKICFSADKVTVYKCQKVELFSKKYHSDEFQFRRVMLLKSG
jgi:hypothetical protein